MSSNRVVIGLVGAMLLSVACASKRVLVPPFLDVSPYGRVGLVTFTAENAKGELDALATEYFAEQVLAAQAIFHWRMTGDVRRLSDQLLLVQARSKIEQVARR